MKRPFSATPSINSATSSPTKAVANASPAKSARSARWKSCIAYLHGTPKQTDRDTLLDIGYHDDSNLPLRPGANGRLRHHERHGAVAGIGRTVILVGAMQWGITFSKLVILSPIALPLPVIRMNNTGEAIGDKIMYCANA